MVNKTKSDVVVQIVAESAKTAEYAIPVDKLSVLDTALEGFFKASQMIADAGQVMASAKALLAQSAGVVANLLGKKPDYEHWMATRKFVMGRMILMNNGMTESTAQSYWEDVICGALKSNFELVKPKSNDKQAEKKRLQREAEAKKYEKFTDSQLLEKAKECAMALDDVGLSKFKAEIKRREKQNNSGLVNECKEVRGEIILRLKGCLNLELLEEIRDMLPEPVKAE